MSYLPTRPKKAFPLGGHCDVTQPRGVVAGIGGLGAVGRPGSPGRRLHDGFGKRGVSVNSLQDLFVRGFEVFRYAELGNVRLLAVELEERGIRSPARNTAGGRGFGGRWFGRGQLYKILSNPSYIARIFR